MKRSVSEAGRSAAREAAAIRACARRGLWRRLLALLGWNPAARRSDAVAARWDLGARAEQDTAGLLRVLETRGWLVLHDRAIPGSRANLDHVLVPPTGDAVVVLDTKRWHAGRETILHGSRVHCGLDDRHAQVEAVARYAARVHQALGMPGVEVLPLLVIHGSQIPGGHLPAPVAGGGVVHVLSAERLVPDLVKAVKRVDRRAAKVLARRVAQVLPPYRQ
jgi:hypothetical protein